MKLGLKTGLRRHSVGSAGLVLCLFLTACQDAGKENGAAQQDAKSLSDEPSPNASILPEPLGGPAAGHDQSLQNSETDATRQQPQPRPQPSLILLGTALPDDPLQRGGIGAGYQLQGRFTLSGAQTQAKLQQESISTWPQLEISLLREQPEQPARMKVRLASRIFSLPMGSELRMRADRLGEVLVWPDGRSYRQSAPGALSALFSDRRMDLLPPVEAQVKPANEDSAAPKEPKKLLISSNLGEAELSLVPVNDLPYAAPLLCQLLLDMVRLVTDPQICAEGQLPLRLHMKWKEGGSFLFEITNYQRVNQLAFDDFRMPPQLPIYKRGELPPSEKFFFTREERDQLFPLKSKGEALAPQLPAPAPALVPTEALAAEQKPAPAASPPRPLDEVELWNTTDRPLMVFVDRLPLFWLGPGEREKLRVRAAPIHYAAQDFWGKKQLDAGQVTAPALVRLGPEVPQ